MKPIKHAISLILAAVALFAASAASADNLVSESRRTLQQLVVQNPAAAKCKSKALAVLVFPKVVKAGFIVGAQGGKGCFLCVAEPAGATGP
jgi:lipid-binding SYLF domain-containing protein